MIIILDLFGWKAKFKAKKYAMIGVVMTYNNEPAFTASVKEKSEEHWGCSKLS